MFKKEKERKKIFSRREHIHPSFFAATLFLFLDSKDEKDSPF